MSCRPARALACCVAGVLAAGCAGQLQPSDLAAGATSALAALPKAADSLAKGVTQSVKQPVGPPTEVYTRVARGVLTCWMGAHGPLRGTHLFQAEAQPVSAGGAAEISIHERIKGAPNQPGKRVFRVVIEPVGERAVVATENLGLAEPLGLQMGRDVTRWSAAEEGCLEEGVTDGWDAEAKAREAAGASTKAKPKR